MPPPWPTCYGGGVGRNRRILRVHQFCRVGRTCLYRRRNHGHQGRSAFSKTVTPRDASAYGLNAIGLERRGFSKERIRKIHHAFRLLLNSKLNTTQALEKLKSEGDHGEDVAMLVRFIEESQRGVIK